MTGAAGASPIRRSCCTPVPTMKTAFHSPIILRAACVAAMILFLARTWILWGESGLFYSPGLDYAIYGASAEVVMPGAIAPPTYSPFGVTRSKVVAVPKSTITQGPPYFSNAATPFTTRSAPTSAGLS